MPCRILETKNPTEFLKKDRSVTFLARQVAQAVRILLAHLSPFRGAISHTIDWSSALLSSSLRRGGRFRRLHVLFGLSLGMSRSLWVCERASAARRRPRLKAKNDVLIGKYWLKARGLIVGSCCVRKGADLLPHELADLVASPGVPFP